MFRFIGFFENFHSMLTLQKWTRILGHTVDKFRREVEEGSQYYRKLCKLVVPQKVHTLQFFLSVKNLNINRK